MAGYRIDRLSSDIQFQLSDIVRNLKDPRVTSAMATVMRVDVTNDLSYATVYVGALQGFEAAKEAVKGLKNASGYIRRELGSRVKMRKVPELRFVADNSAERSAQISRIIDGFKKDEQDD